MSQPSRSIALHIGAHKTATTHLQRSFAVQQKALNGAGVRYFGPDSLRGPQQNLHDIFGINTGENAPPQLRGTARQLDHMFQDGHRLILSDENFIGVMHNTHGNMRSPLYRQAEDRVAALVAAVAPCPVELFISIRNPATFMASAYGQVLMGHKPITFADYIAQNPVEAVEWGALITRLRSIPNLGQITIWKQEEYRWRFYKATGAMMGDDANIRIAPLPDKVHVGLSQKAVDHVLSQAHDPRAVGLGDAARRAFPVSNDNPAYAPFTEDEIKTATAAYELQIAQIEQMDGVTILRA